MPIRVTSGSPLGLRALGGSGRPAVEAYRQIFQVLYLTLAPEHAALLAEPNMRAGVVDWFTSFDTDAKPVRLSEAPAAEREAGLLRLERLMRDIESKAAALQKSDRADERILGGMLADAIQVPNEDSVFLVGTQPVLTFWGYVPDHGKPTENPVHSLLRRRPRPAPVPPPPPASPAPASPPPIAPAPAPAALSPRRRSAGPAITLWAIFTVLLVAIGVMLLRACALGLPASLTGWFINYCAASADSATLAALAAERSRQALLQAEYEELIHQAEVKRQACFVKSRPPATPLPVVAPKPATPAPIPPTRVMPSQTLPDKMVIPRKPTGDLRNIQGCWRAHQGLTEIRNGKDTGKKLSVTFCFDQNGSGSRTIRYEEDGARCTGTAQAHWEGDQLIMDVQTARCQGNHGIFSPSRVTCHRGENGEAVCDETAVGATKPNFANFPFTRLPPGETP